MNDCPSEKLCRCLGRHIHGASWRLWSGQTPASIHVVRAFRERLCLDAGVDIQTIEESLRAANGHPPHQRSLGFGDKVATTIKRVTGISGCGGCKKRQAKLNHMFPAQRVPLVFSPLTFPRRNLIMHLYPLARNDRWRWNVDQILSRIDLFNGNRILSVATDKHTVPIERVETMVSGSMEVRTVANHPKLGEIASFLPLLEAVMSDDHNACTFYCHGKGVSDGTLSRTRTNRSTVQEWTEWMYRLCLDDWPLVERLLQKHGAAGAFRKHKALSSAAWYYSGTFFWIRNCYAWQRNWRYVAKAYYGSEAWPGTLFDLNETACIGPDNVGSMYDPRTWQKLKRRLTEPVIEVIAEPVPLTLITPTGDRPEAFALCEQFMQRQTSRTPYQWIVIDDGKIPTRTTQGQEVIQRTPQPGVHTLAANLRAAIPKVRGEKILIIEDDEWYAPAYVETLAKALDESPLAGVGPAVYYWPRHGWYREFPEHVHASLCRTGFRRELLPDLAGVCASDHPSVDLRLWQRHKGTILTNDRLSVGIKGMPGRKCGGGDFRSGVPDPDRHMLHSLIGDDCRLYDCYRHRSPAPLPAGETLIVYTVNTRGYDVPTAPLNVAAATLQTVDFVAISDVPYPAPWRTVKPDTTDDRCLKIMGPQVYFPTAKWTLYFDAQLQLIHDPLAMFAEMRSFSTHNPALLLFRHQDRDCLYAEAKEVRRIGKDRTNASALAAERYRKQGFPEQAGLYLGGMLLRHQSAERFNSCWWNHVSTGSRRDQISLPVALAESGITYESLPALWWEHYFTRHDHASLQRMRAKR